MNIDYAKGEDAKDFARRIEDSEMQLELIAPRKDGRPALVHEVKGLFYVTESYIHVPSKDSGDRSPPSFHIRATKGNHQTINNFRLDGVDPYAAETALFLDLHPAKLGLKPQAAIEHLATFGIGEKGLSLFQNVGMSTQDAAEAIRMQHELAKSSTDNQEASDFLSSLDFSDLAMDDRGMSLTQFNQS